MHQLIKYAKQGMYYRVKPLFGIAFLIFVAVFIVFAPEASANLVQNGNFTSVTYSGTTTGLTTLYGQFGTGYLTVSNWSTNGYNFVYAPGTADVGTQAAGANPGAPKEAPGEYNVGNYGNTYMWGTNNGGNNAITNSPAGGNFIAMDGAFETAAVSQTITGLKVGQMYQLTFYWAAAQQESFTGNTTDAIQVTFGGQTFTTGTYSLAAKSFSGWMLQKFNFTATSTSQTLSFLAIGTPTGQPPFALVSGVDLEAIPEISSPLVLAGFGVFCIAGEAWRRRKRHKAGAES